MGGCLPVRSWPSVLLLGLAVACSGRPVPEGDVGTASEVHRVRENDGHGLDSGVELAEAGVESGSNEEWAGGLLSALPLSVEGRFVVDATGKRVGLTWVVARRRRGPAPGPGVLCGGAQPSRSDKVFDCPAVPI